MSPLLKNMDEKKLINQVVRTANQLKEEIETSLKMRQKQDIQDQSNKQFISLKKVNFF